MGVKFFNNLELEQASHVQFKTAAGANAGKIEQSGDDLLLTNATGDILLGSGSADVNIGDGTNNVDIRFEQSMAIFADSSSTRTLTLGGVNTNVVVESPTLNTPTISGNISINGTASMNNTLTFTTANGYILFDHEPSNDTGMYTNTVPLLKIDRNGNQQTILQRDSEFGALTLGIDDTLFLSAGDTKSVVRANTNFTAEQVILAAEGGFFAFGFPNNDTTWSNRNTFRFRSDSNTASENGLYLGDSSNGTIFMDINRNLSVVSVTSAGHIKAQAGGNVYVYDDDDNTKIHSSLESNATEGVLKISNGANFGLIARGVANAPRLGAFHGGSLRIYGFTNSNGTDGADDHELAMFDFANNKFQLNGSGGFVLADTTSGTNQTTLTSFNNGGNSRMKIKGGNFIHTVAFETSKNDFEYAELISSYNGSDSKFRLKKSNSDTTSTASTVTLNTGVTTLNNLTASGGTVLLTNLPTSDPNNAGQLWNDSGTLKISAG